MNFDSIISETNERNGGPQITSQNDNPDSINWAAGLSDPGEMIACGYMPEAMRKAGESDQVYQKRLIELNLPELLGPERFGRLLKAAQDRANLNVADDGTVSMFSVGETPWHELGKVISEAVNSAQALPLMNGDYEVAKIPTHVDLSELGFGDKVETDSFAIVRLDNGKVLTKGKGVGARYEVLQNSEVFELMDEIVGQGGAKFHTGGVLGDGERVWMLAEMPDSFEVAEGDEQKCYLLGTTAHDGSGAIQFCVTTERVVCQNTLRAALTNGKERKSISFRHTKNARQKATQARQALGFASKAFQQYKTKATLAANSVLPDTQAQDYFALCLDDIVETTVMDKRVTEEGIKDGSLLQGILAIDDAEKRQTEQKRLDRCIRRRERLLEDIVGRYETERNNGMESIKDTGWSAYNAVSEFVDHSPINTYRGERKEEKRFDSILTGRGDEIKQNALELVLEVSM